MTRYGKLIWLRDLTNPKAAYRCDCGVSIEANRYNVRAGRQVSCGCHRRQVLADRPRTNWAHGMKGTKEHKAWRSMRQRCYLPTNASYALYGGRGITVCDDWLELGGPGFLRFYEAVGPAPSPDHSIDRIDNDGNYEPGNVRWATAEAQTNNRTMTVTLSAFGRTIPLAEASREFGIERSTLKQRVRAGWDHERALLTAPDASRARKA